MSVAEDKVDAGLRRNKTDPDNARSRIVDLYRCLQSAQSVSDQSSPTPREKARGQVFNLIAAVEPNPGQLYSYR